MIFPQSPQQKIAEVQRIFRESMAKLRILGQKRQGILKDSIKKLEVEKIRAIRLSLGLPPDNPSLNEHDGK